jgi:hypothetical protein
MVAAVEQLQEWRRELAEELRTLEEELVAASQELTEAQANYGVAVTATTELTALVSRGVGFLDGMAGPLGGRLELARRDQLRAAARARGAALARVDSLQQCIAARALAIKQIDVSIASSKVIEIRPGTAQPRRRTPAPVEYDTITSPAGAR